MTQTTNVTPEVDDDQPSTNGTKLFGDNFQRCHEGPTQNRFIIGLPLIRGHFSDATNDLCFAISYRATIRSGGKGPGQRYHVRYLVGYDAVAQAQRIQTNTSQLPHQEGRQPRQGDHRDVRPLPLLLRQRLQRHHKRLGHCGQGTGQGWQLPGEGDQMTA